MSSESKIKLIDTSSQELIQEFPMDQVDQAYAMAEQLEAAGASFELKIPSVTDTLVSSLGMPDADKAEYEESIKEEIEGHNH